MAGQSKAEQAFVALRRDILDARLVPGQGLTIVSMRDRYGLGWTPIREALSRLEAERLVVFAPNRGYRVATVSGVELLDLQNARKAVELVLLEESMKSGGDEWEQRVVAAHHGLRQAPPLRAHMQEADLARWEARHEAFHQALLSGSQSIWLPRLAAQIMDQLHRHHRILVLNPAIEGSAANADEHCLILQQASDIGHHTDLMHAAISRDRQRACSLLIQHIGFTHDAYLKLHSIGSIALEQ